LGIAIYCEGICEVKYELLKEGEEDYRYEEVKIDENNTYCGSSDSSWVGNGHVVGKKRS
jgi:uncharacterized Fe-S cluster protein YjdI